MFASNDTQMVVISGWNGSYGSMRPRGHVRHLALGDNGHTKCAMGPKQSLEGVLFGPKSPCPRGVQGHVLGLQCHSSGCDFWLEWFVCINGTQGTHQMARTGYVGYVTCSMVPKRLLERVFIRLKRPCLRGVQRHVLGLHSHPSGCDFRLE